MSLDARLRLRPLCATVRSYLGNPLVAIPTLLLLLSGTWHMRVGMQIVPDDYIHKEAPKVILALNNLCSLSSRSPASPSR